MNRPLNVLHVLGTAQPEGSGIARIVASLAKGLNPQKYRVHAWFLQGDGPLVSELNKAGAFARSVPWNAGSRDPLGAWRFWRHFRSEEFAIVHQHWGARSIRHLIRRGSTAKIVVHVHGRTAGEKVNGNPPIAVRGADTIIAVSQAVALQLADKEVQVIYSGIETLARTGEDRIDRDEDTTVIGTACRLVKGKGVEDLILAFTALSKEVPPLRLEIAGAGPEERSLLETAQVKGIAQNVKFLGWRDDLRYLLGTWDIFVLPSYEEGLPIAVLEAMAEQVPVVATDVGGLPELVENGLTGYLIAPGDVNALHNCLLGLVKNREARIRFGTAGRVRAESQFSVAKMITDIESVYDSLTNRAARP